MTADESVLDDAVHRALSGPHAAFALRQGRVVRYHPDVAPFGALPPDPGEQDWRDAAALLGPEDVLALTGRIPAPAPGWTPILDVEGVQMIDDHLVTADDEQAVRLGHDDVPAILDLIARTQPGPFARRTIELGTYLGIRREGQLVAMAGERLHPPGFTEISAVCTDPDYRGQGLATRLVRAVAHGIRSRGETPFLHAAASNVNAIRLYESLGFRLRRTTRFAALRPPGAA